jgi:hypothetical protein
MNIINELMKEVVKFAAERDLDLKFITMLIDYLLSVIEVDIEIQEEVETYINNVRLVNTMIVLLGITTDYSDKERKAYDNNLLIKLLDQPERLINYKKLKVSIYNSYHEDKVNLFEDYRKEVM